MQIPYSLLASIALVLATHPLFAAATGDYGPDTCLQGYVWREAVTNDHVCVTPATRSAAAVDNSLAASRRSPTGGAYGPDTCLSGYVWREATPTDHVCVPPSTRTQTAADNAQAANRRASLNIWMNTWEPGPVCNGDVCTITSDSDTPRFLISGDHFNLASVTVGVYLIANGSPLWQTSLTATAQTGRVAGSFEVKANVYDCASDPTIQTNAYLRAYDSVSDRWSSQIYVKTGCLVL